MARLKQFSVGFSRTINLGNYESARVEASVVVETDEDDPEDDEFLSKLVADAQTDLRKLLEETWKNQNKTIKKDNGK